MVEFLNNYVEQFTPHSDGGQHHQPVNDGVPFFNYVVLADNTLQPPHAITARIRLLLEPHALS